jgi:membrane fusion protein
MSTKLNKPDAATTPGPLPLYRAEAIAARRILSLGSPIGLVPVSWTVLTLLLATLMGAAGIFLATATYARKETARGIVRPFGGDTRITAQHGGIVRKLLVTEGTPVARGAPLAIISTERVLESGAIADEQMLAALAREEAMLRSRLAALEAAAPYGDSVLKAQISALVAERSAASALRISSAERLRIAEERFERGRTLNAQGFIPADDVRQREEAVIEQRQVGVDARARETALTARIAELQAQRAQQPHVAAQEHGQAEAQLAALLQRRSRLEAGRSYAILAPVAGRVTAVQAEIGQPVDPNRPLMTITPADSRLEAELYVPSRSIGFVRGGQRVRLMYDAFPYERFGPAYGVVTAISAGVLSPAEIQAAISVNEPVYRVLVRLQRGSIETYGSGALLKSGMALSADIILDERSFGEWLLAPLFAARERM